MSLTNSIVQFSLKTLVVTTFGFILLLIVTRFPFIYYPLGINVIHIEDTTAFCTYTILSSLLCLWLLATPDQTTPTSPHWLAQVAGIGGAIFCIVYACQTIGDLRFYHPCRVPLNQQMYAMYVLVSLTIINRHLIHNNNVAFRPNRYSVGLFMSEGIAIGLILFVTLHEISAYFQFQLPHLIDARIQNNIPIISGFNTSEFGFFLFTQFALLIFFIAPISLHWFPDLKYIFTTIILFGCAAYMLSVSSRVAFRINFDFSNIQALIYPVLIQLIFICLLLITSLRIAQVRDSFEISCDAEPV